MATDRVIYVVDRLAGCNEPITLLGCMISAINQNPLSRGGPKYDSRNSCDIQSPSQGDVNLKVRIADPLRNEDCSTAILFSLITVSVNENKCVTAVRIPTKVIDEKYGIHDVLSLSR